MNKSFAIFAAVLCTLLCSCSHDLVIVHMNDTHSHFDPLRDGRTGIVERTVIVDSIRRANGVKNTLLLHAGDFSQGSSYFTMLHGDLEIDAINAMGYDCVTLGNHEFDNGIEDLGRRLSGLECPVVCANYDFSTFEAGKYITPYTILQKAGRKIGIIGVLCDISTVVSREIADRIPALETVETVNKWAAYLKNEEKCDLVIALTHIGLGIEGTLDDLALVPQTRDVDLVVGGHSHTFIDDIVWVKNLDGKEIPIVQDGCWGYEVAEMRVSF